MDKREYFNEEEENSDKRALIRGGGRARPKMSSLAAIEMVSVYCRTIIVALRYFFNLLLVS